MKRTSPKQQTRLWLKALACALAALAVPLAVQAQQTVFYDNFSTSSLNQTNISGGIPGGIPTASQTSYTVASAKNATATTILPNHLQLITASTSSGNSEVQAVFTKYPVTLVSVGDYVEMDYTFTDLVPVFQSTSGTSDALFLGIFNSGGVAPQSGGVLENAGFSSSLTTADQGGTVNWVGDYSEMYNGSAGWRLYTRPVQTALNNLNQGLLYNVPGAGSNGGLINPGSPNLAPGQPYTVQLRITLSAASQLTVSNALYLGGSASAPQFTNTSWTVTGANVLTTNFDSLAIGYRATDSKIWTNDINSITVIAGLAAQAGPYFSVTSAGNPCSGGVEIGLNGSVTTNNYLLYNNGIYTGQSSTGTGAAISFPSTTTPGNYTIIATNPATMSSGPMYGSANVYAAGIAVNQEPSSVTAVTNVTSSFSFGVSGAAISYQWYAFGAAMTNGGNLSGVTSSNLVITLPGAANAASGADGYYCVAQTPCGDIVTSAPNASLTLIPPHDLVWQGGNSDNNWEYSELNFTNLSGTPEAFTDGDDVTFNDSSGNTTVTITNNLVPTLVTVSGTQNYTFSGTGKLTGFGQLVDSSSGTLTINAINPFNYTGGTIVDNGATLSIGDGTSVNGAIQGTVDIMSGGTLEYHFAGPGNLTPVGIFNALAGTGTNNVLDANGSILQTQTSVISSNFTGTINIQGYTCLHAADGNAGYALGNGSTINVPDNTQVWLDRSSTAYNNIFNIGGTGWQGATPNTGAMRVYGNTINGPINLMDNARIGGTINGAAIQSVISGPYQLEVWGTTNSFVLSLGPTNGSPQGYASTLITSGAISAVNSNAISTGPLTIDVAGDMQLNGKNITVANLSSINSGQVPVYQGATVRNNNTTNAATLTVGSDGTSTEFDGTFLNGAAASLGLTKVGAGALTLTGVNTNTGAVTVNGGTLLISGSGSFGNASQIIVASGAVYDVTGAGGTLTLNSGQSLNGNGSVNGNLVGSAGSTVAPGLPLGTLTVSGNATVNGTYRASLNRTNTPSNCSLFTASGGSITYSGATLSVTNVGPALQVGDTFQLFGVATAGFSSFAPQTNDPANNVTYVWNNTVAANGEVSVGTVNSRMTTLQTAPAASVINYGQALSSSILSGGSVTNATGGVVSGTFAFTTPSTVPVVGAGSESVTFTPSNPSGYNATSFNINVTVIPQTPVLKTSPAASTITNGSPLSASILTGGVVTNAFSTNVVAGTFAFTTPSATPGVGTASQSVTFTPTNTTDYNSITFNVNVTVVAEPSAVTALRFTGSPVVSGTNLTISVTNTGAGTFYLLSGTNLPSASGTWMPLWTNVVTGSSSFTTTVTNAVTPALGKQFYILSTTNN